jgi:hypothetical protein
MFLGVKRRGENLGLSSVEETKKQKWKFPDRAERIKKLPDLKRPGSFRIID